MSAWLLVFASFLSAAAFGQTSSTKRPNPPSRICIAGKCADTPISGRIKWNPGHYMASESILRGPGDLTKKLSQEMNALRNHPGVLGYRVITTWGAIEKSRGEYDFSLLDQVMKTLKTGLDTPKRLVLVILPGTFSGGGPGADDSSYLPLYLRQDDAYGPSPKAGSYGWWHYPNGGYCAAVYRQAVMDRYIALMEAVGAHFDGEPNFEGIMIQEDAWMSQRLNKAPDFSEDAFTQQLKRLLTSMTAAFPHTSVVMQATWNGSKTNSTDFVHWMIANRIAPSSADTIGQSGIDKNPNILAWGLQAYVSGGALQDGTTVADLRSKAAAMMDVEAFDMVGDYYAKSGGPFSPQDILEALNKTYQASHAFWTYLAGTEIYRKGSVPTAAKWSNLGPFLDNNPLKRTGYPANYP
jgi:hypothetical protein